MVTFGITNAELLAKVASLDASASSSGGARKAGMIAGLVVVLVHLILMLSKALFIR